MEPAALPNGPGCVRPGPCYSDDATPNDSRFLPHQQYCLLAKSLVTDAKLMEGLELAAFPLAAGDDAWSRLLSTNNQSSSIPSATTTPLPEPVVLQRLTRPLLWCVHCQTTVAPCDVAMRLPADAASQTGRTSDAATSACHFAIATGLRVSDLLASTTTHCDPSELTTATTTPRPDSDSSVVASLPVHLLAWTTAPWSLALNEAVVLSPLARYSLVLAAPDMIAPESETHAKSILTSDLAHRATTTDSSDCAVATSATTEERSPQSICVLVSADALALSSATTATSSAASLPFSLQSARVLLQLTGAQFLERVSHVCHPVLHEQYVPLRGSALVHPAIGTGIVHVVPGCSDIDFQIGLEIGLNSPLCSPVDAEGCFDASFPIASLRGASFAMASDWVLQHLRTRGLLCYVTRDALTPMPFCLACSAAVPASSQHPLFYRSLERLFYHIKSEVQAALTAVLSANEAVFLPKRAKKSLLDALEKWLGPESHVCLSACQPATSTTPLQRNILDADGPPQSLHPTFRLSNLAPFFAVLREPVKKEPQKEEGANASYAESKEVANNSTSKHQLSRRAPSNNKSATPKAPPQPRSHVFYFGAENVPPSVLFSFLLRFLLERPTLLNLLQHPLSANASKKPRANPLVPTMTFLVLASSRGESRPSATLTSDAVADGDEDEQSHVRLCVALAMGTSPLNLAGLALRLEFASALHVWRVVCMQLVELVTLADSDGPSLPPLAECNNCVIRYVLSAAHVMATKTRAFYAALDFQSAYHQLASFAREMESVFLPLFKFFATTAEADVRACAARVLVLFLPALMPLAPSLARPFAASRTFLSIWRQHTTTRDNNSLDSIDPRTIVSLTPPNLDPSLSPSKQEKFHWTHALRVREVVLELARAIAPSENKRATEKEETRFRVRFASASNKELMGFQSWLDLIRVEFIVLDMPAFLSVFFGLHILGEILLPVVPPLVAPSKQEESDAKAANHPKSKPAAANGARKIDQPLKLEQAILVDYVTSSSLSL